MAAPYRKDPVLGAAVASARAIEHTVRMCLLIVLHRVHPDAPLIVAANRDEWLSRAATASTVLQAHGPRILGGRDDVAGGTWLSINEHGVFAGLTNRPTLTRDPSKRSRGELPLALAQHESAHVAAEQFASSFRPSDFSPAWLFVADRASLALLDMTQGERPAVTHLQPGVHILENRAWHSASGKVRHVRARLAGVEQLHGDALFAHLHAVLRDHTIPQGPPDDSGVPGFDRPRETEACCVHAGPYGTRSSTIVIAKPGERPRVWTSDGPPCTHPLIERTALFTEA
jgi:uncharacterized protein with NRDE domain